MTVDIATLAIRIDSLEARNATRDLNNFQDAGGRAERSTNGLEAATRKLNGALAFIGVGAGVGAIIKMADEYAKFTAQLRLAAQSQREYAAAYGDVKRIANVAQQDLAATGVLYARIANGTRELGVQQKQVAAITETVNLALKVSGATATESASAQLQLSQAFASGTLRGEEFNAVNEAAPRLMLALADGIGVPVGALKKMAEEGQITSKIMSAVLPNALLKLQEEAKNIQTISGAFTVLKNNVVEFTGVQAQASGTVSALTGAIGLLANNLGLVTGAIGTMIAANVGAWLAGWIAKTYERVNAAYAQVAADAASRAATVAAAEAEVARTAALINQATVTKAAILLSREEAVVRLAQAQTNIQAANTAIAAATAAGAQSFALRTLRLATAELAVAEAARVAMVAELALLGQQQARVSAQITAATVAQTAAQNALTAANGAGAASAGLLGRAVGFLGGPVSALITLLGIAATAWMVWGDKGAEAEKKATATLADEIGEYLANLDKQIAKLKERNELAEKKMTAGTEPVTNDEKKREQILGEINRIAGQTDIEISAKTGLLMFWGGKLNDATQKVEESTKALARNNEITRDVRLVEWFGKNGTAAQRMAAEIAKLTKEFGTLPKAMLDQVREKYMSKGENKEESAAAAARKQQLEANINNIQAALDTERAVRAEGLASIIELNRQGLASDSQVFAAKVASAIAAGKDIARVKDAEIAELAKYNGKDLAERIATQGKIQKLEVEKTEALRASAAAAAQMRVAYAFDREKPLRDAQDAANKEVAAINQQVAAVELQARTYGMLPAAITAATVAELEAQKATVGMFEGSEQAVAAIDRKIEAYQRLGAAQSSLKAVEVGSDVTKATELLKVMEALDDAAKQAAQGMEASFGRVGKAIGSLTTALTGYSRTQAAIAAQLAAATKDAGGDQTKIAKANAAAQQQGAQAQIKSYGDMAAGAKSFFKVSSTGYKTLEGVEKAYRAYEMAMAVEAMVKKIFFKETEVGANVALNASKVSGEAAATAVSTGLAATEASAWGITAVVKALASLPFPANLAAGAATLAAVVAIGANVVGAIGGGKADTTAKDRQKAAGTGSILGDKDAKSESISRALELAAANSSIELTYTRGMLESLRSIESSLSGLGNLLVRNSGLTGEMAPGSKGAAYELGSSKLVTAVLGGPIGLVLDKLTGGLVGKITGSVFGKIFGGKVTTLDTGVTAGRSSLGGVLANGISVDQYTDIKKSGGLFSSSKNSTQSTPLGAEANDQFAKVIAGLAASVTEAGKLLGLGGDEFTKRLNSFVVDIGKISLKGLTGEEIQKQLETVFSKLGDDLAAFAVGGLEQFQQVGEGYFETLTRIATNYANLDSILAASGTTFGQVGLQSIAARERLIGLAGGIDELASKSASFNENFLTEAQRLAPVQKYVTDQLAAMGLVGIDTRDKFRDTVLGLANSGALATEAGAKQYAGLMDLAEAFAKVYEATEDLTKSAKEITEERKTLQAKLDEVTMSSAQLREKERATIAEANRALYDSITAAEKIKDARQDLSDAYDRETTKLEEVIKAKLAEAAATKKQMEALKLGALSTLSPEMKLAEAKRQFDAAKGAEKDSLSSTYLEALKGYYGSTEAYAEGYAKVQAALALSAASSSAEATVAQQQLTKMDKQAELLLGIKGDTATFAQALASMTALIQAGGAQKGASNRQIEDLYATLLGRQADASGLAFWSAQAAAGASLADLIAGIKNSSEYKGLHGSHRNGLDYVPFDGYRAELHKGERVQTAAQVKQGDANGAVLASLMEEVLVELRAANAQRGEVGKQTLEKAEKVADGLSDVKRQLAKVPA